MKLLSSCFLIGLSLISTEVLAQIPGLESSGYRGPLSISILGSQQQGSYKNTLNQAITASGLSYGGALSLRLWSEVNSELRLFGQIVNGNLKAPSSSVQESFTIQRQSLQGGLKAFVGRRFFIQAAYTESKNSAKLAQTEVKFIQHGLGIGAGVEFRVAQNWFIDIFAQGESLQGPRPETLLGSGDSQSMFYGLTLTWSPSLTVKPTNAKP